VLFKKSVESVMNELNLLKCLKDDFLINALYAFQDRDNLYLIMDLVNGGDLRFHLIKNTRFNESQTSTALPTQSSSPAPSSSDSSSCTTEAYSIATSSLKT
jgi:serine/threonine protein kinase